MNTLNRFVTAYLAQRPTRVKLLFLLSLPILLAIFLLNAAAPTHIVNAAVTDVEVTIFAAPNLVVDSNVLSPSTQAPEVATVIGRFCNTSGAPLSNIVGYIGTYNSVTPASSTPGLYPAKTNVTIGGTTYNGTYRFTHLGGTQDAIRIIGSLAPGQCSYQYWSFSYPKTANGGTIPTWGNSVQPHDDLFLDFDVWAAEAGTICNAPICRQNHVMTMRNEISAMANKIQPNGNPAGQWFNTNAATVNVGETITTNGILYRLGNVNKGFDNNGDLVPDYNAWLQPIGNPTYDPSCFRLIEASGVLTVTRSAGNPNLIIPFSHTLNQQNNAPLLYFTDLPPDNTDVRGLVYYTFMALSGPCTIPISPYQEVASGFDNEKFNGDYGGGGPGTVNTYAPNFDLDKTGPATASQGGGAFTYNIPFQNSGSTSMGLSLSTGFNAGLVISDTVPNGLQYVAGSAALGNTAPPGNGFTIYYSTNSGRTWSTTDPGTITSSGPNNRVILQWWLTEPLGAGQGGTVTFQAQVPANYLATGGAPFIENCTDARLGTGAPLDRACAITMVQGNNSLGDTVWSDNGAGTGIANNGLQDGSEVGIPNVTVTLYWDRNGNGQLDPTDPQVGVTTSNASGIYTFSNLPDGRYIVVVDSADTDIPTGYGPTTPQTRVVLLDPTSTNPNPVVDNSADFGFGPVLAIDKNLTSLNPAYVGETVQYSISLYNKLPGDGTAQGFCTYTLWATVQPPADGVPSSGSGNSAWLNIPNGLLGAPDNNFAYTNLSNNEDTVGISGFNMYGQSGTITNVRLLAHVREIKNLNASASEYLRFIVFRNNTSSATFTYDGLSYFTGPVGTDYVISQPLTGSWAWADFQNNLTEIQAIGSGTGSNRGDVGLDAVALVITTDQQCSGAAATIAELPLVDTYDPAYLEFVSASPPPSSQTPGTITWNNLGPLYGGGVRTVTVTFRALQTVASTANTATSTNGKLGSGRAVNNATDAAIVTINTPGSIAGVIWAESSASNEWTNPTGYSTGDSRIPGVTVQLYGCYGPVAGFTQLQLLTPTTSTTNQPCNATQNNGNWVLVATRQTASDGSYQFTGLRPGYYNVVVVESTLPPGFTTRTGDPAPAGNGVGIACGTCDGQWNSPTANLNTFNDIISGENVTAVNFGYRDPDGQGAITGYVWNDRNANGVWGGDEESIRFVNVYLCTTTPCTSSTPGAILTTTDSNGRYTFGNLNAGTYYVGVTPPSGMSQSGDPDVPGANCGGSCNNQTNAITLVARQVSGPYNFGYTGGLTIGDTIYADWNGNGSQNSGEEGISGVQVQLYRDLNGNGIIDSEDTLLSTQVTDAAGFYQFTNLAGNGNQYLVRVVASSIPAGYVQTADPGEAGPCVICDHRHVVTLTTTSINTVDFGYRPRGFASIGDYIWHDQDGDGNQDSNEPGINGVTVNLYQDENGNGVIDPEDALVATTVTASGGLYNFINLAPANYIVAVAPGNFSTGQPLSSYTLTSTGPAYTNNGSQVSYQVALAAGQQFTQADFGFAQGLIGDFIWRDDNGNGTPDPNEPGISGVTVSLYNDNDNNGVFSVGDTLVATTVTDSNGLYQFGSLPAGNYVVVVTPPANYTLTGDPDAYGLGSFLAPPCDPTAPANYAFCDHQYGVQLLAGQTNRTADFGYKPLGVIGDTLWIDGNNNGVRENGEAGIPYITVRLCSALPCTGGNIVATTITDSEGNYSFGGLSDGTYFVQVDSSDPDFPVGLSQTFDPDGTLDHTASSIVISGGVVTSIGGNGCTNCDLAVDFGYRFAGNNNVSGTIWHDDDGGGHTNGIGDIDPGETYRYEGVTVYLWHCGTGSCNDGDEVLVAVTTTDANGQYSFTGLANGTYAVTVNPGSPPLQGANSTTPTGYIGGLDPNVVLTGGTNAQRDFGFLSTMDFGDLPASYNNTRSAVNGARHVIGNVRLGVGVDADPDGQESPTANLDTDDGVTLGGTWVNGDDGGVVNVTTTCPSGTCYLSAWIDWNNDGDFNDSGERIFLDQVVTNGLNVLTFDVPAGTFTGSGPNLIFNTRFRLYAASTGGFAQPTGLVVNGEVEDYQWTFGPTAISLVNLQTVTANSVMLIILSVVLGLGLFTALALRRQSVWVRRTR